MGAEVTRTLEPLNPGPLNPEPSSRFPLGDGHEKSG